MNKNDIITLKIEGVTNEGAGVGRHDGLAVFVPFTAVGDVIECKIVKVMKNYCYGRAERITEPSVHRREPDCEAFSRCGGCDFRHMSYEEELRCKETFVRDAFSRIGGVDIALEPIISTGEPLRYRNKAQLPVCEYDGKPEAGFFSPRSHRVIPCGDCALQPEIFTKITRDILDYQSSRKLSCYDEASGRGLLRHIYLRRGYHSGELAVCLVVTENTRSYDGLSELLAEKYPEIRSFVLNINPARTNVILGERDVLVRGSGVIRDSICGVTVELSPHSFYQVNTAAAELLYKKAAEYAGLSGCETVLDLYCGAGTIGLSLAKSAGKVIGVEIVPEAVENARKNAEINGVTNAEFRLGDAGKIAGEIADGGEQPDVIILDPPRKGCDGATVEAILRMSPARVVMISCNPATAARDVKLLCERGGYRPVSACPVDMFPRTRHVEAVCLLSKLNVK